MLRAICMEAAGANDQICAIIAGHRRLMTSRLQGNSARITERKGRSGGSAVGRLALEHPGEQAVFEFDSASQFLAELR